MNKNKTKNKRRYNLGSLLGNASAAGAVNAGTTSVSTTGNSNIGANLQMLNGIIPQSQPYNNPYDKQSKIIGKGRAAATTVSKLADTILPGTSAIVNAGIVGSDLLARRDDNGIAQGSDTAMVIGDIINPFDKGSRAVDYASQGKWGKAATSLIPGSSIKENEKAKAELEKKMLIERLSNTNMQERGNIMKMGGELEENLMMFLANQNTFRNGGVLSKNVDNYTKLLIGKQVNDNKERIDNRRNKLKRSLASQRALGKYTDQLLKATHNKYQEGGDLNIYQGYKHEQGGIPLPNSDNEVETGEVGVSPLLTGKENNYIVSDSLKVSKSIANDYNLPKKYIGKTLANVLKDVDKQTSFRENDPINQEYKTEMSNKMVDINESIRKDRFIKAMNKLQQTSPDLLNQFVQSQSQGNIQGEQLNNSVQGNVQQPTEQLTEQQIPQDNIQQPQMMRWGGETKKYYNGRYLDGGDDDTNNSPYFRTFMNSKQSVDNINNPPFRTFMDYRPQPELADVTGKTSPNLVSSKSKDIITAIKPDYRNLVTVTKPNDNNVDDINTIIEKEANKRPDDVKPRYFKGFNVDSKTDFITNNETSTIPIPENQNDNVKIAGEEYTPYNSDIDSSYIASLGASGVYDIARSIIPQSLNNYGRINGRLVNMDKVNPYQAINAAKGSYNSAEESLRNSGVSASQYLANRMGLANKEADTLGDIHSKYDTANTDIRNKQNAMNVSILNDANVRNQNIKQNEIIADQQDRAQRSSYIQQALANADRNWYGAKRDVKADKMQNMILQNWTSKDNVGVLTDDDGTPLKTMKYEKWEVSTNTNKDGKYLVRDSNSGKIYKMTREDMIKNKIITK